MGPKYFDYLQSMLKERSGLVVTPDKVYLLETRLLPVAHRHGYKGIDELVDAIKLRHDESIAVDIAEAMNTHESLFFRDSSPFDLFKQAILPQLLKRRADKKSFRIWCAACSTGQEPYSLAMVLDEVSAKLQGWRTEIIATDISHSVLDRAAQGVYSQFEVQRGLPVQMLVKHFTQQDDHWQLNTNIRDRVNFRHFNLLGPMRGLGKVDIIFCRNVLIYFDVATKTKVLDQVSTVLNPDGVLFLGSAESTIGITDKFWPVEAGRGVYKHTDGPASIAENA